MVEEAERAADLGPAPHQILHVARGRRFEEPVDRVHIHGVAPGRGRGEAGDQQGAENATRQRPPSAKARRQR
jgi:hypothetical protein